MPRERLFFVLILPLFLLLAVGNVLTRAPWCDEAYFAEPAYSLLHTGHMASIVAPPSPIDDPKTFGTDRYMFYTMPLDLILQAGWYAIAGFGIFQMRLLTLGWACVSLAAWWLILTRLGAGSALRLAAIALIALDYTFIHTASDGRMDMMSASLGVLGVAVFLKLQQSNYTRAVVLATLCSAAAAFTHPIGGLISMAVVGLAMLWYSDGRLRWWHVALAAVPYLVFAALWGIYIAQAPDVFRKQFLEISRGRLGAWRTPFATLWREWVERWAGPFGLTSPSPLKKVKGLVLLVYAAALGWSLFRFQELARKGWAFVAAASLLILFILCFGDSTKSGSYLIYAVPWLAALAAFWMVRYWRPMGVLAFAFVLLLQVSGSASSAARREYQREYLPAAAAIRNHGGVVTAVASLGFALGFQHNLTDDRRLGFYSGAKPALFAFDKTYGEAYDAYRTEHPDIYRYLSTKIERSRLVFQSALYKIYQDDQALR